MNIREFLEKYCLHDSTIDEIEYDAKAKELIWHMDFAFWMQNDYIEGTPENGLINLRFHQVETFSGSTGKIDWFSVDSIIADSDNTVTCTVLDDYNEKFYRWTFSASDIEIEDLHIDTTGV